MGLTGIDRMIEVKQTNQWMYIIHCKNFIYTFSNDNSNITVSENNTEAVLSMIALSVEVEATTETKIVSMVPSELAIAV